MREIWSSWMAGQIGASVIAGVLWSVAVLGRQRLPPPVRSGLLTIALMSLALPLPISLPWSGGLADLPILDDASLAARAYVAGLPTGFAWFATLVTVVSLLRLGAQSLWFMRRIRQEGQLPPRPIQDRADALFPAGSRRRRPAVVVMPDAAPTEMGQAPFAAGVWRPVIVIPERFLNSLDALALNALLGHEAGHHARRDISGLALASVLRAIVWFNPLAHLVFFELRSAREDGADDWAVERTALSVEGYAGALLRSARLVVGPPSPLAAAAHPLKSRLTRLLDPETQRATRLSDRARLALALVAITALPCASGASFGGAEAERSDRRIRVVVREHRLEASRIRR